MIRNPFVSRAMIRNKDKGLGMRCVETKHLTHQAFCGQKAHNIQSCLTFVNCLEELILICPSHNPIAEQITPEKERCEIASDSATKDGNGSKENSPPQAECICKHKSSTKGEDGTGNEQHCNSIERRAWVK